MSLPVPASGLPASIRQEGSYFGDTIVSGGTALQGSIFISQESSSTQSAQAAERAKDEQCLRDLRLNDPEADRKRIKAEKGGLLPECWKWILKHTTFLQWMNDDDTTLLWIKGDPGKGKTMMMVGLTEWLSQGRPANVDNLDHLSSRPESHNSTSQGNDGKESSGILSFFFCQSSNPRHNSAASILRGIILRLVHQQGCLIRHVRREYDLGGPQVFNDQNAFYTLETTLAAILDDPELRRAYIVVDALDECEVDRRRLLELIVGQSTQKDKVKWIVTSRHELDIADSLGSGDHKVELGLEENSDHISHAVNTFVELKIDQLMSTRHYNASLQEYMHQQLNKKAESTFLWVALACEQLQRARTTERTRSVLEELPSGLGKLYQRMMELVEWQNSPPDVERCKCLLRAVTLAYRPVRLRELRSITGFPEASLNEQDLMTLLKMCGSFLNLQDDMIHFVHLSAKDYFIAGPGRQTLLPDIAQEHRTIYSRCIRTMSTALRYDMCQLERPGALRSEVSDTVIDNRLGSFGYACCYWARHLIDSLGEPSGVEHGIDLCDHADLDSFLGKYLLHWLEALSLLKQMSEGEQMIVQLLSKINPSENSGLFAFVQDTSRFVSYNRLTIEEAPLQLYSSCLVFAPKSSVVRDRFRSKIPPWIRQTPNVDEHWSPLLRTIEDRKDRIALVALSSDGKVLTLSDNDRRTVKIWDCFTGGLRVKHETNGRIDSAVFSPNSTTVAIAGYGMLQLWNTTTGDCVSLGSPMPALSAITFSPDGSRLASVSSYDGATILVWDVASHKVIQVLEDHTYQGFANLIKFSQNGQLLAVIRPRGDTILIWTMDTGVLKHKLSHSHEVAAFAISPDNNRIASISRDELAIWNLAAETREAVCLLRIRGFRSCGKEAVAFSPDGELLAIGLPDGTVQLREAPNWEQVGDPLGGIRCSSAVHKVMFASKGTSLLFSSESAELGRADLLSGDLRLGRSLHCHMLSHGRGITSWNEVMFSPDGHLAASRPLHGADTTFAIFNMDEQMRGPTVDRHSAAVHAVSFSSCGSLIASTSADDGVKVWDSFHGTLLHTLAPDKPVRALFSPAGKLLIWPYGGNWVRQYEPKSAKLEGIFESGSDTIMALAVAPQGILMGTFSKSDVLKVWDMETGQNIACSTLPWQRSSIMRLRSMKFSPDGRVMVFATGDRLGMYDGTIGVWDWKAGVQFSPFSIRSGTITPDTFWFSRDGKMVAFEMQRSKSPQDRRVMLWDWKSGSFCQTQSRHSFLISAIAFSPKNDLVASASRDETVKLWDAFTGQLRVALAVGTKVFEMSFSDDASSLQTNRGRLDISSSLEIAASAAPAREQKKLDFGTNVFVKDRFIARGLEDVLWLPPEYVASCAAVHGNRVAIGHESGRVTFFTFDFSRLPVPPTLSSIRYAFGGGKDDTKRRRRATTTTDDENDDDDENDNDNNKDGVDNRRRREKRTR